MHPFRIAILIFLLGGTLANVFLANLQHDSLRPATAPVSTQSFDPNTAHTAEPRAVTSPNIIDAAMGTPGPYNLKMQGLINDRAYLYETAIVTLAATAWFLVPVRRGTQ